MQHRLYAPAHEEQQQQSSGGGGNSNALVTAPPLKDACDLGSLRRTQGNKARELSCISLMTSSSFPYFLCSHEEQVVTRGKAGAEWGSEARGDLGMLIGSVKVSGQKTSGGGTKKRRGECGLGGGMGQGDKERQERCKD
ncbi:hypothetical protein E2C01_044509 [Portunus trituberculatus]|uniref:Uncharacterized protein n=1 Tax=Portunus trituberculatus TaxID=210409 RepID=A0A5B7FSD1_PORTR|nr:hypothetical protein [Portunus trituberculatus]